MNDPYNSLVIEVQSHLTKINEKINTICSNLDKLEEKLVNMEIKLEANKLVNNEKTETNNYKLSVLEEKINSNNQKVNDLNNIMMKHFAYKSNKSNPQSNQSNQINSQSISQSIIPPTNTIPQSITPNPFALNTFTPKQ
jgi:chromosome segregation ATPase